MINQLLSFSSSIALLVMLLIISAALGAAILLLIARESSPKSFLLTPFIGLASLITVGLLSTSFGLDLVLTYPATLILLILCTFIFRRKESKTVFQQLISKVIDNRIRVFFALLISLAAGIFAVATQFDPVQGFTFFARTGPDGIGYAISSQVLSSGLSPTEISAQASQQFGNIPIQNVISSLTSGIYDLPSFTLQVQNEFLVGAQRIGFASLAGFLLQIIGMTNLWMIQAVLAAICYSITVLLGAYVFGIAKAKWLKLSIFSAFLILSPVLLYSWFEGGVGQVFAMPAFVAFFAAVFYITDQKIKIIVIAGSVSLLVGSYLDGFFLAMILLACLLVLGAIRVTPMLPHLSKVLTGIGLGIMISLPVSINIPQSLASRASDSGQAGWQVPSDLGLLKLLGLTNFYTPIQETSEVSWGENQIAQTTNGLLIPIIVLLLSLSLIHIVKRQKVSWELTTLLLCLCAISAQFVLTQLIGNNTNYQLLKMSAMVIPLIFLCAMRAEYHTLFHGIWPKKYLVKMFPSTKMVISLVAISAVSIFSISFMTTSAKATVPITQSLVQQSYKESTSQIYEKYMFVTSESSTRGVEDYFLGTLGDFYWLNRGPGVLKINPNGRSLALLGNTPNSQVNKWDNPFSVITSPQQAVTQKYIIDLHVDPAIVSSHSADDACLIAGIIYSDQHEVALNRCNPNQVAEVGKAFSSKGNSATFSVENGIDSDNAVIRFISTIKPKNENIYLLSIQGTLGSGMITLSPKGQLIYLDAKSGLETSIGWASELNSTFASLKWNASKLTIIVNGHPVGLETTNLGKITNVSTFFSEDKEESLVGTVLQVTK